MNKMPKTKTEDRSKEALKKKRAKERKKKKGVFSAFGMKNKLKARKAAQEALLNE